MHSASIASALRRADEVVKWLMSAFGTKRTSASGPFPPRGVYCVRFDDSVSLQPTDIVSFHSRCRFRTHLLDCPTQSSTKRDGPKDAFPGACASLTFGILTIRPLPKILED